MANIDWLAIKNEYINTATSYRKLAKKYNVSQQSISAKGKKEKWVELRKNRLSKTCAKIEQKTAEKIIEAEVDRIESLYKLSDTAIEQIKIALGQLNKHVDMFGDVHDNEIIDVGRLKKLTAALKEIKEILRDDNSKPSAEEEKQLQFLDAIERAVKNGTE